MEHDDLTIVLPTLNEAGNIRPLVERLHEVLPGSRVIVVDDSSTDGTRDAVRALMAMTPRLELVAREGIPCLTESIMAGVRAAATQYVAWMDADFSHPPEVLKELHSAARRSGCAVASRYPRRRRGEAAGEKRRSLQNDSMLSSVLSAVLNFGIYRVLRLHVTDYTSGFIVCRRSLIANHDFVGDYGEYFIELMHYLELGGVEIREIPYQSPPRAWGESKTGTTVAKLVRRGLKYLWMLAWLNFARRPSGRASQALASRKRD
jgi:dolichol-phosphate mannosyltransferase